MDMQKTYNPKDFEDRIYADWEQSGYFRAEVDENKVPFTIMMPPPNITGQLHMGHAMDATMQDTLIRFKRMQGYSALWLPGCDVTGRRKATECNTVIVTNNAIHQVHRTEIHLLVSYPLSALILLSSLHHISQILDIMLRY